MQEEEEWFNKVNIMLTQWQAMGMPYTRNVKWEKENKRQYKVPALLEFVRHFLQCRESEVEVNNTMNLT